MKVVDEVIASIRTHPTSWQRYYDRGMVNGNVKIDLTGNSFGWFLDEFLNTSIATLSINGHDLPLTMRDKYKIESVFTWWIRTQGIETLSRQDPQRKCNGGLVVTPIAQESQEQLANEIKHLIYAGANDAAIASRFTIIRKPKTGTQQK